MLTLLLTLIFLIQIFNLIILVQVFYLPFLEKKRIKDYEAYQKLVNFDNLINNK